MEWMSDEAKSKEKNAQGEGLMETLRVIIQALALAFVVHVFLFQPFTIPSGSMIPTLLVGDYLFVSKFSYGYSKYSFPFGLNIFNGRIFGSTPERGDVAVFKLPRDNKTDYIKRVIGLPGDRIEINNGILYINGQAIERERTDDFVGPGSTCNFPQKQIRVARYIETLPNGVKYPTLDCSTDSDGDRARVFVVPEGHYFMMGDNRDNSTDSRFSSHSGGVGFVPFENFVGRADIIFFSADETASWLAPWRWPFEIRWGRFFELIR